MTNGNKQFDAVIVGAGFAGLYLLYLLRNQGLRVRVIDAASGVGGTWYWNRYPGARCDVESIEYSYSFSAELEQQWQWSERFAAQPEILAYLEHVAERFDLYPDIQFDTRVNSAHFDEGSNQWVVTTDKETLTTRFCIMATGCLSSTNVPEFPGLETFVGEQYHTGKWPHEPVDFSGKRVGLIGTGSSGIQATPVVAEQAKHLYVFQRTANWSVPACNRPLSDAEQAAVKAKYKDYRAQQRALGTACHYPPRAQSALDASAEQREQLYEEWWQIGGLSFLGVFSDLIFSEEANNTAAEFIRKKIKGIVKDPEVAEKLCPDHAVGCKRPCSDTHYYETFNRDNVTLVDVADDPIETFTAHGLKTTKQEFDLDCVIFATGFDAMTGSLDRIDIRGLQGQKLKDKWQHGPQTYLGLMSAGFPNLFTVTGPGSPSVLASMTVGIEHHAEWIADCIKHLRENDLNLIDATPEAEQSWGQHVNEVADETLYPTCNSWYVGANIPGKPRVFLPYIGGFPRYESKCQAVVDNGYEGFSIS